MDLDQVFFSFFAVSAVTSFLVLVAEAARRFSAPRTEEDSDG
ncbi:hypothetical protein [Kitasatospora sp. MBT66]|nr:hypothetical protein [Kitasatospora sp. MBT66]